MQVYELVQLYQVQACQVLYNCTTWELTCLTCLLEGDGLQTLDQTHQAVQFYQQVMDSKPDTKAPGTTVCLYVYRLDLLNQCRSRRHLLPIALGLWINLRWHLWRLSPALSLAYPCCCSTTKMMLNLCGPLMDIGTRIAAGTGQCTSCRPKAAQHCPWASALSICA